MGITYVKVKIGLPPEPKRFIKTELLVDTGAYFSVVPGDILISAGIKPRRRQVFTLANGKRITRQVGYAVYKVNGYEGVSEVVFGKKSDKPLLGVITLESLGLEVDPRGKKLKPAELLLLFTKMGGITENKVIEEFNRLPLEDEEYTIEII